LAIPLSKRRCLYTFSRLEAERFQRQLSRDPRAPRTSAEEAIARWNRDHWWDWASERYLEHIAGDVFWEQFGESHFGALGRLGLSLAPRRSAARQPACAGACEDGSPDHATGDGPGEELIDLLERSLAEESVMERGELIRELERRIEGLDST
jgi:hypothetical protein